MKQRTKHLLGLLVISLLSVVLFRILCTDSIKLIENLLREAMGDSTAARLQWQTMGKKGLLLDTPHCPIPDLNPFSSFSVLNQGNNHRIVCKGHPAITYTVGSYLKINWTSVAKVFGQTFHRCQYQPFARHTLSHYVDFVLSYLPFLQTFVSDTFVPEKFQYVRVICFDKWNTTNVTEYHTIVHVSDAKELVYTQRFEEHIRKHEPKETYNVYMLGVESVSRLNFVRLMPKTRKFLLHNLEAFEMLGFNKVGDNTFPNLISLLTGHTAEELNWTDSVRFEYRFDDFPLIWKNFSQAGYRTMFAEDNPEIAIFNFNKMGLKNPLFDVYNRPQRLQMYNDTSIWSGKHCIGDTLETKQMLDDLCRFATVFQDRPQFAFTFISQLTHDDVSLLPTADDAYLNFFKAFKAKGCLNKSVLFFFSDHGYRYGRLRDTYFGKHEERMPMLYIVFPPTFRRKYPKLVDNLRTNSKRLITPFDIHATLLDILFFHGVDRAAIAGARAISLFREVSAQRTCQMAGILPHWCLCWERKELSPNSPLAEKLGHGIVSRINGMLTGVSWLCAELSLHAVTELIQISVNNKVLLYHHEEDPQLMGTKTNAAVLYQVTLTTTPGLARFEATVTYDPLLNSMRLAGEVSRINKYNDDSFCVDSALLKKICYCND